MYNKVDKYLHIIESSYTRSHTTNLYLQNKLLREYILQLKQVQVNLGKYLSVYKRIVLDRGDINEVLELQHKRIVELYVQLYVLRGKHEKLLKNSGSESQTSYAIKCKYYQKQLQYSYLYHQKYLSKVRYKLMRATAKQIVTKTDPYQFPYQPRKPF